jgi:hypothetical protein
LARAISASRFSRRASSSGICQCRLNFPQKRRLKIPHFVLD